MKDMHDPKVMARMAYILIAAILAALLGMFFVPIPPSNKEAISLILGALLGSLTTVMSFYFGSSKDSADKNSTIVAQAETARAIATGAATSAGDGFVLAPGDTAAVTPTPAGTVIQKEPDDGQQVP